MTPQLSDPRRRLFMQRIPTTRAELREAAERVYDAYAHRTRELEQARLFLASVASADPQTEQAEWMVTQAREGLRRCGGHDFDANEDACPACGEPRADHVGPPTPPRTKGDLGETRESAPGRCLTKTGVHEHRARKTPSYADEHGDIGGYGGES